MPDSVHTARWIAQIADQGWDIYLFPAYIKHIHKRIQNISVFGSKPLIRKQLREQFRFIWWTIPFFMLDWLITKRLGVKSTKFSSIALTLAVRRIKPDLVHSLEIQHAGYLTLKAKQSMKNDFPKWIVTNWGSDLFLYGRLAKHKENIRTVLENCDFYSCECQRDIKLARDLGFQGEVLPVLPNTGGMRLDKLELLKSNKPPSERRLIMLKGYQHFAGRALVGLQALKQCLDALQGYKIGIFSTGEHVEIAAELFEQDTGIPVESIPYLQHDEMLQLIGQARISIGLSISDAISTSLLEAMTMGAFPIQSNTACVEEWVEDGVSALVVPPEDPHKIANAIRHALADDELVNSAAELNAATIEQRLEYTYVKSRVIDIYENLFVVDRKLETR